MYILQYNGRNATGAEVDDVIRHTLSPDYFGYRVNDGVADSVVFAVADTYQTFIPDPTHIVSFTTDEFSYNPTTGEITYTGDGEMYSIVGSVSVGFSVINTICHFGLAVNGVILSESSSKLESTTAIQNLSLAIPFNLTTGDIVEVKVKSNKIGTMEAFHAQGIILELKPSMG